MKTLQIMPLAYHLPMAATPPQQTGGTTPLWLILELLLFFLICAVASFLVCKLAKALFPKFRSGEHSLAPTAQISPQLDVKLKP